MKQNSLKKGRRKDGFKNAHVLAILLYSKWTKGVGGINLSWKYPGYFFFLTPFLTQSYRPTSSNTTLCDPAVFGGPETVIKIIPIFQTVLDEATEPWGIKVERVEM